MNNNERLQHIAHLRYEYTRGGLCRKDLTDRPLALFEQWLSQAYEAQMPDPNAMCLATVDYQGQPYQRMVLLKHYNESGMVFYTNLGSRKAQQLVVNKSVSVLFPWNFLERQVMVLGKVEKLSVLEVVKYFHSRPRNSQISTWASQQSSYISSRNTLEMKFLELKQRFSQRDVPLPNFWGGFRIKIDAMEFWQGRENRLHDRFFYQREGDNWKICRLAP